MRGPANSSIVLTVIREGVEEPLSITVVRDVIRLQSVRYRVDDDVGYIRIASFSEQTMQGLERAVSQIALQVPADRFKGFVLDLRGNPGGLLDQAVQVTDAFLDRGEIVSTRGRHPEEVQRFNARAGDLATETPLIVLVNGGSASASEIVAGALQDHRRATIVGTASFGKGSVQTIIPIGRSGAIRLTTARYYTPSGRSIQARGIDPDIVVLPDVPEELLGSGYTALNEADLRGHLLGEGEGETTPGGEDDVSGTETPAEGEAVPAPAPLGLFAAYVPEDPALDRQLNYAYDLLRGVQVNASFPPSAAQGIPN
jgi:carboxyl-terminal processing protease